MLFAALQTTKPISSFLPKQAFPRPPAAITNNATGEDILLLRDV